MDLMIRMLLIVSLVTQLVWSMECCGVVVLRPDIVSQQSMDCAPLGTCATAEERREAEVPSCCASPSACETEQSEYETACETSCGVSCASGSPCEMAMCSPLEQKKPSAAVVVIDFIPLVAHPFIPPAMTLPVAQLQTEPVAPMILKCNHTRQAWLEVWRN